MSALAHGRDVDRPAKTWQDVVHSGARLTHAAHLLWSQKIQAGDVVVDATCGNGRDTLMLANLVGDSGTVHAFDLQASAVTATKNLLQASGIQPDSARVRLHCVCHTRMTEVVGMESASLVVFNLGYLPKGDRSIKTEPESTVKAIQSAMEVIQSKGLISVMAYTKHHGGMDEYQAVKTLCSELPTDEWVSAESNLLNRPSAPRLISIWRR